MQFDIIGLGFLYFNLIRHLECICLTNNLKASHLEGFASQLKTSYQSLNHTNVSIVKRL